MNRDGHVGSFTELLQVWSHGAACLNNMCIIVWGTLQYLLTVLLPQWLFSSRLGVIIITSIYTLRLCVASGLVLLHNGRFLFNGMIPRRLTPRPLSHHFPHSADENKNVVWAFQSRGYALITKSNIVSAPSHVCIPSLLFSKLNL